MASDEQNGKFKKKALFEGERGPPFEVSTDQFRCVRCRKSHCTYYRPHPHRADEPVITYVTCVRTAATALNSFDRQLLLIFL